MHADSTFYLFFGLMRIQGNETDDAILRELGIRISRTRLNRNQTQQNLAKESGVSERTIIRIENGESTQAVNMIRVIRALGMAGNFESLIPEQTISPVQALRMQGRQRQRASGESASRSSEPWKWGDEE